ncbi:tetratricopeptide repeat protein [Chondrocystis sp. NIES-4102]|nr:tetratricopeptide repeat protein [Chondrocystis sp. NIES-4102]
MYWDRRLIVLTFLLVEKLPNKIDLLLLQFKSDRQYPIATISKFNYRLYSNNDYENKLFSNAYDKQYVFVSGFPLEVKGRIFARGFLFDNSGTAISYQPDSLNENNFGGYELIYTNLTHPGMSGGAVLDTQGRLIGIHGRADGRKIGEEDEIIREYLDEVGSPVRIKIGLSLGIPIQTFLAWASNQPIYNYLNIESSAPLVIKQDLVDQWQPPIAVNNPNNPYHWLEKGNQLWRIGRVAESRGAYNKAIELREDLYLAWFAKGFALGFDENYELALEACEKAIELQVTPSRYKYDAYRCKAGALQALQQFQPALDSLNQALDISPDNPADWMAQGELRYALGQYQLALQSFNKAAELRKAQNLHPSSLLYNNRALVQLELGNHQLALEDIETAINIDSSYPTAWSTKGLILETVGRDQDSLNAYNKATELDPDDYTVWTNKAFVLNKLGRDEQAKQSLETALKIKPDYQPAINSLEVLMQTKK